MVFDILALFRLCLNEATPIGEHDPSEREVLKFTILKSAFFIVGKRSEKSFSIYSFPM